jgi:ketosteroid isomerase-like protein
MTAAQRVSSPAAVVEALYRAINERDYEAGFALLADDFEWLQPEHTLLGGPHRGLEAVRAALERQFEVFDEFAIEPEEFHERGARVAVTIRQRATGGLSGAEVEIRIGHLWTVEDGEIVRLEVFAARDGARRAIDR